jgi:hypothetical protein
MNNPVLASGFTMGTAFEPSRMKVSLMFIPALVALGLPSNPSIASHPLYTSNSRVLLIVPMLWCALRNASLTDARINPFSRMRAGGVLLSH